MKKKIQNFEIGRMPARLNAEQSAEVLGAAERHIPIL
jgi:hypothetical protein